MTITLQVSQSSIDCHLNLVRKELLRTDTVDQADRHLDPLVWYIATGRAPIEFLRSLLETKPYLIARRLRKGGTTEEVINRICDLVHFERA